IEVSALDDYLGVSANCIFSHHGVRHVHKVGHFQRDRFGDALDGQVTVDGNGCVTLKVNLGRFESCCREGGSVQEVVRLDVLVEQLKASLHRGHVDHNIHLSGFCSAVQHNCASGVVEAAQLGGQPEVVVGEARKGVSAVYGVGFRCREGRGGQD